MYDLVLHANAIERMIAELAAIAILFRSTTRPPASLPTVPAIRRFTRRPWVTWRLRMLLSWLPGPLLQWLRYWLYFGKPLPLHDPRTFTERLMVKMARDRNPALTRTADRVALRAFVEERLGPGHLPELLAVVDRPEEIEHLVLPERYVAKATHGSQMVHLVQHDSPAERQAIMREARSWMRTCYWRRHGEWPYRNIPRRVIIESFIETSDNEAPADWKWYCFNGKAAMATCDFDRFADHRRNVYDAEGKQLDLALCHRYPQGSMRPVPSTFAAMREIAERLAAGFEFVRVDLYDVPEGIIVGELTHCPAAGLTMFNPPEWDHWLGERWATSSAARG